VEAVDFDASEPELEEDPDEDEESGELEVDDFSCEPELAAESPEVPPSALLAEPLVARLSVR
jgi:hypothetical protein